MIKKTLNYITSHKIIAGVIILVVILIGYYTYTKLSGSTVATQYVFGKVQRGDLVVSVSGSGQVSTLSKVEIKPQTTGQSQTLGQIIKVNVINGQTVKAGDVVAILDGKSALQSVNQAKSSVASAQANYDKLVNGATDSDLQSNNNTVQSAQISLQNSLQNISTKLQNNYISISNSIFLNTDQLFEDPVVNPILTIRDVYFNNLQLKINVENERRQAGLVPQFLKDASANVLTSSDPVAVTNSAIDKLTVVRNYFDDMTSLLTLSGVSVSSSGATALSSAESAASSARSNANSAVADMISALQSYQNAVVSLSQAKTALDFKKAPANPDDVVVAQAQLDNAKANLANALETYASRIVTAPFDGQIGGLSAQVGQQISSSDVLGTIITPQKVVNVSLNEVDAAKVKAGDAVELAFDALPDVTVAGKVSFVDPLGTVTQGVVNYAVQIGMDDQNDQIKAGMTATANIITDTHTGVLMVPTSAITKNGNRSAVLVPNGPIGSGLQATTTFAGFRDFASSTASSTATSTATSTRFRNGANRPSGTIGAPQASQATTATVHPVPVIVGISNDTMTEIISGLNEGDSVVTRTISGTATKTTTTQSSSLFGGAGGIRTGGGGRIGG